MTSPSLPSLFSLASKTAIVTGGTGGLGLAMSIALAEAGADIVAIQLPNDPLAQNLASAIASQGRALRVFEGDVGNPASLRRTFSKIWESGIVPDILLNCAGIVRRGAAEDLSDADIDAVSASFPIIHMQVGHCRSSPYDELEKCLLRGRLSL